MMLYVNTDGGANMRNRLLFFLKVASTTLEMILI